MLTGDSGLRVEDCLRRPFNLHDLDRSLGTTCFLLLRVLATDPTRVFSKDELMSAVWGTRRPPGDRTVDSRYRQSAQDLKQGFFEVSHTKAAASGTLCSSPTPVTP